MKFRDNPARKSRSSSARYAGGKNVIAIDPVEYKLDRTREFGATHTFSDPVKAREVIVDLTWPPLATPRQTSRRGSLARRDRAIAVGRPGRPDDIAAAVAYLASEASGYMTGQMLELDGGGMSPFPVTRPPEQKR